jgi:hypothetical protein
LAGGESLLTESAAGQYRGPEGGVEDGRHFGRDELKTKVHVHKSWGKDLTEERRGAQADKS